MDDGSQIVKGLESCERIWAALVAGFGEREALEFAKSICNMERIEMIALPDHLYDAIKGLAGGMALVQYAKRRKYGGQECSSDSSPSGHTSPEPSSESEQKSPD